MPKEDSDILWRNVVVAALMMLATLPGRTQGLGLITEPMLADLHLERVLYADLNLWATLLGSAACLPAGWLLDRYGLKKASVTLIVILAAVVWRMSAQAGSVLMLFILVLLTRAVGQSALSVASITVVGKTSKNRVGLAMGVYSVLLSVMFAAAFGLIGSVVRNGGWRKAWGEVALTLVVIAPIVLLVLRERRDREAPASEPAPVHEPDSVGLASALRTPAFWTFAGATALFGLVSSGLGLFNEAVLAERGFSQKTYHEFLAVTTLIALVGQLGCGWLSLRWRMQRLLSLAMLLYAAGLAVVPMLKTYGELWVFAALVGLAGGMITVLFFAIWAQAFGRAQLGRIQGAAQMLTVFASAVGPLMFARSHAVTGSYASLLLALAVVVFLFCIAAWLVPLPSRGPSGSQQAAVCGAAS